ncbi:hypothetical protein [Rhodococcus jostii]|uniref:hypothetical protein n=1 Tax=Rhodococcus jostii TaxID=132919 RepID=UPI0036416DDD
MPHSRMRADGAPTALRIDEGSIIIGSGHPGAQAVSYLAGAILGQYLLRCRYGMLGVPAEDELSA